MMDRRIRLSLLRGVCQIPAYVACTKGFFEQEGLEATFTITPTAWLVPNQLASGECDFAVLPWTRVALAEEGEAPLRVVCGSGFEEAALVVRKALRSSDVRCIAVPREGGMKDLTARGLIDSMGWSDASQLRYPSGDGAIIALFGQGADAAAMVEPFATLFEALDQGRVVRRTGDVWPGAPGCSLACSKALTDSESGVVGRAVRAYVRAIQYVIENPDRAAEVAEPLIGVKAPIIAEAIRNNPPRADGIRNADVMRDILLFMQKLGYVEEIPDDFVDLTFMDAVTLNEAAG
jgi:ABC-type nitrate/sulfonate/bicarbonate transport system substrate-binding protein